MKKKSLNESAESLINVIAKPLIRVGNVHAVAAVRDGLIATIPLIIIGSLFLLIALLGQDNTFSKTALMPILTPYSGKLVVFFAMTMNFIALYAALAIALVYASKLKLDLIGAGLLSLASFLLFNIDNLESGLDVKAFAATGLFTAIISSLLSVKCYSIFIERNITIKMPEGVPPNVVNAFVALVPYFLILSGFWFIRSVLGFNFGESLNEALIPILNASDNIVVFTFIKFVTLLLWGVGMHGDNMMSPLVSPMVYTWVTENALAVSQGVPLKELPHVWTTVVERISMWPASVWSVLALMWFSRLKQAKTLAIIATPAAIFTIIEPVVFGLPLVLNPFLIIPFILSGTIASLVTYAAFELEFINRVFVELPWATPPFISGYVATGGDWLACVQVVLNFLIGLVIYYPFWKAYERSQLGNENDAEQDQDLDLDLDLNEVTRKL